MFSRFRSVLVRSLSAVLGICVAAMVGLAILQVILRYVFASSLIWVEEISVMFMLWMTWLGITVLWLKHSHITVDLLTSLLPQRVNIILALIIDGIAVFTACMVLWASRETLSTMSGMELDTLPIDLKIKYFPVPVGAAGLGLAALLDFWAWFREEKVGE